MTNNNEQHRHGQSNLTPEQTTVRQPSHNCLHEELTHWAFAKGVGEEAQLVANTFGASETLSVIGNVSLEFSHPESEEILEHWSEEPAVAALSKLHLAYQASPDIHARFPPFTHHGNTQQTASALRKAGADIAKRHSVLFLCATPLAGDCEPQELVRRRKLRLWLIIQAVLRMAQHHYPNDLKIDYAARFIAKDVHNQNWKSIDHLLSRAQSILPRHKTSFRFFSLAIERAALELNQARPDRNTTQFLNAIVPIAQGQLFPGTNETHALSRIEHSNLGLFGFEGTITNLLESSELGYQDFQILPEENELDDDGQTAFLFAVDPAESPEQQRLTGRSILIQSAELSHYLPWSLDKALPPEVDGLNKWLEAKLRSSDAEERLGSAITWLAIRFSRSLPFVLQFGISNTPGDEWCLSTNFDTVHRNPPRRHNSWYPKDLTAKSSVSPFEDCLSFKLPSKIQSALLRASESIEMPTPDLHTVWFEHMNDKPDVWFKRQAKNHFPRLTSAKLANIHAQKVFDDTADHSLARMISAHPRSALPAVCGYGNWDVKTVEAGFALPRHFQTDDRSQRVVLLGSLLDPIESRLIEHIESAAMRLAKPSKDGIEHHNLLTQYTVMALYAATGCRYLTEPFESASHFCASPPSVFINDKSDGGIHNGRMVPLPDRVLEMVGAYEDHLGQLAESVQRSRPDLSYAIRELPSGRTTMLPFFFLLDSRIQWHPLSEQQVPGGDLFSWPLPRNLFRHRFAQQLARAGVNSEVIDSWMGHGERGVATYGDTSPRCWVDDSEAYRSCINDIFNRLPFVTLEKFGNLPPIPIHPHQFSSYIEPSTFGQKKRSQKRRKSMKRAINDAREEIQLFIGVRKLGDLTPSELDRLCKLMLLRDSGLPHPLASVRLSVLVRQVNESEARQTSAIKHRLALFQSERSLVNDTCSKALSQMPVLEGWSRNTKQEINRTKLSKSDALAFAAVHLIIEKRLTYFRLVTDIAQGSHYRLVQHKKLTFLEYTDHTPSANCQVMD